MTKRRGRTTEAAVCAVLLAAACARLESEAPPQFSDASMDARAEVDALPEAPAAEARPGPEAAVAACAGRGQMLPLAGAVPGTRVAVGPSVAKYGPASVDVGGCGPSGRGYSPHRLQPESKTCTSPYVWTGSGATFLGEDLLVAGFGDSAPRSGFGMARVRWSPPEKPRDAELSSFRIALPSVEIVVTRDVASEGARLHVSGSANPSPRAIVVSFDLAAAEPSPPPDTHVVVHEEPRLVSFDDLAVRGDGSFWASGRTGDGGLAITRFGKNELPDTTFGEQGFVSFPGATDVRATKVLALADGGVLVGAVTAAGDASVRRVTAAGVLDTRYGQGGVVRAPFPVGGLVHEGRAQLALERSGAVRFAGADPTETGRDPQGNLLRAVKVARVLPDGALDMSFGEAGLARAVSVTGGGTEPSAELLVLLEGSDDLDACAGKLAVGLVASTPGTSSYGGFLGTMVP